MFVNTFTANAQLEEDSKGLCKILAVRFAKEILRWKKPVTFRWATLEENKKGADCFVSCEGKSELAIDFKIRREGVSKYWKNGQPDIAIEISQPSTYGWATQPNHDPSTVILFVFLDGLADPKVPLAVAITLSTCQRLAAEAPARGFQIKPAHNGHGLSQNVIVPIAVIPSESYRVMHNSISHKEAA